MGKGAVLGPKAKPLEARYHLTVLHPTTAPTLGTKATGSWTMGPCLACQCLQVARLEGDALSGHRKALAMLLGLTLMASKPDQQAFMEPDPTRQ